MAGAVASLAVGCGSSPTALIIQIDSNIPVGTELRDFEVSAQRENAPTTFFDNTYSLLTGSVTLPASLAVIPRDPNDSRTVTVVVTGHTAHGPVVQRARVRIAPGHVSELDMYLEQSCVNAEANHTCATDETCGLGGVCIPVDRGVAPPYMADASAHADGTDSTGRDVIDASDASDAAPDVTFVRDAGFDTPTTDVNDARDAPIDVPIDLPSTSDVTMPPDVPPTDTGATNGDATSACGAMGQPCCSGATPCADPGFICLAGTCSACGEVGLPCCPLPAVRCATGTCTLGTCVDCGPGIGCCGVCDPMSFMCCVTTGLCVPNGCLTCCR
jgi:hypothetical protein